jgi:hypothetical protein
MADNHFASGINSVHLEDRLGDVNPIVVTVCMGSSSESWEPQQRPHPWHSRAGGAAVHSINSGGLLDHLVRAGEKRGRPSRSTARKPLPGRPTSRTGIASVAGAILINAPTLEGWYLPQGPAVAISRTTRIHALPISGLSGRKGERGEIGVTRIGCSRTR